MIKKINKLSSDDFKNLHGNELYITMLRNKTELWINIKHIEMIDEYLETSCQSLYYVHKVDTYGHIQVNVYFESPVDCDNFVVTCNTVLGLDKLAK